MAKRSKATTRRTNGRRWRWAFVPTPALDPADLVGEELDDEYFTVADASGWRHDNGGDVPPGAGIIRVEAMPIGPHGPGEAERLFPATLDPATALLLPDDYTAWERACERMPAGPVAIGILHRDFAMLGLLDHSIVQMRPDTLLVYERPVPPRLKRWERLALELCDEDGLGPGGMQHARYGISLPDPWEITTNRRKRKRGKAKVRKVAG